MEGGQTQEVTGREVGEDLEEDLWGEGEEGGGEGCVCVWGGGWTVISTSQVPLICCRAFTNLKTL